MSDVFISYSRKDSEFVRILHEALEKSNRETWVDWEGIAKGTEWWKEIEAGIEGANTFVFVISPDSVASTVCQDEINHAIRYNKQILPIVYREPINEEEPNNKNFDFEPNNSAHKAIRSHNWLFFRKEDDFSQSLTELIDALNLDIAHVKGHTRFLVRALEWDNKGRKDGFLLKDENLIEAEDWLKLGVTKDPKPTDLQVIYIENSRKIEDANNQAVLILKEAKETAEKQIEEANLQVAEAKTKVEESNLKVKEAKTKVEAATVRKKQIIRQGSIFLGVIVVGAGTALSFASFKTLEAQNNLENTNIQVGATEAKALWIENPQILDNLLLALKTGNQLKNRLKQNANVSNAVQWQTKIALQQAEQSIEEKNRLTGHKEAVISVSYSPDGKTLASASRDKTVKLWDVVTGKELKTLEEHPYLANGMSLSVSYAPDGKTLASASSDGRVKLWDVVTGQELKTLNGHQNAVRSVSYSPDGKTLASASLDGTVKLWDMVTGKELKNLKGHQSEVYSVSYSPDGKTLASTSGDKTVKLWDVVTGKELKTLNGHQYEVYNAMCN